MQWLKKAENFSLVSTVVGTTIAIFTQKIVYAVAPMTLTLCLSLQQRREQQKNIDRLQHQVSTLHHQFDLVALPSAAEIELVEDNLSLITNDILSTSKSRRKPSSWEKELTVIERLERLEFILYRLEESHFMGGDRGDFLLLEGQISALAQEFSLLLDKIVLEHNLHYSELKATILNEVNHITNISITTHSEEIVKMKDELQQIKSKLTS